jgi:hypothetical protein
MEKRRARRCWWREDGQLCESSVFGRMEKRRVRRLWHKYGQTREEVNVLPRMGKRREGDVVSQKWSTRDKTFQGFQNEETVVAQKWSTRRFWKDGKKEGEEMWYRLSGSYAQETFQCFSLGWTKKGRGDAATQIWSTLE